MAALRTTYLYRHKDVKKKNSKIVTMLCTLSFVTCLDFPRLNVKHPVELKCEVEGACDDDDTEVVDDEVALGDGQHHPVFFLQVA